VLFEKGVKLSQVATIQDNEDTIIDTIRALSVKYDFVFTSGGIGPTHDDMYLMIFSVSTYESIAKAFGQKCVHHRDTVKKMEVYYAKIGKELNDERLRMALLPEKIDVYWTDDLWVPLVKIQNVYILPGVPEIYTQMLSGNIEKILEDKGTHKLVRHLVYTDLPEGDYSKRLREIAHDFKDVRCYSC
jgi:molybdopterin-biosynthesis enzyme MoeA-like protein